MPAHADVGCIDPPIPIFEYDLPSLWEGTLL